MLRFSKPTCCKSGGPPLVLFKYRCQFFVTLRQPLPISSNQLTNLPVTQSPCRSVWYERWITLSIRLVNAKSLSSGYNMVCFVIHLIATELSSLRTTEGLVVYFEICLDNFYNLTRLNLIHLKVFLNYDSSKGLFLLLYFDCLEEQWIR